MGELAEETLISPAEAAAASSAEPAPKAAAESAPEVAAEPAPEAVAEPPSLAPAAPGAAEAEPAAPQAEPAAPEQALPDLAAPEPMADPATLAALASLAALDDPEPEPEAAVVPAAAQAAEAEPSAGEAGQGDGAQPHKPLGATDSVIARLLVAWHNRHPLARRVREAEIGGVGLVRLSFAPVPTAEAAALGVTEAEPASRWARWRRAMAHGLAPILSSLRRLKKAPSTAGDPSGPGLGLALFDEPALVPGVSQRALQALARQHGFIERPGAADWPVRELAPPPLLDLGGVGVGAGIGAGEPIVRYLISATVQTPGSTVPTRVLIGRGRPGWGGRIVSPVRGRRQWQRSRWLTASALGLLLGAAGAAGGLALRAGAAEAASAAAVAEAAASAASAAASSVGAASAPLAAASAASAASEAAGAAEAAEAASAAETGASGATAAGAAEASSSAPELAALASESANSEAKPANLRGAEPSGDKRQAEQKQELVRTLPRAQAEEPPAISPGPSWALVSAVYLRADLLPADLQRLQALAKRLPGRPTAEIMPTPAGRVLALWPAPDEATGRAWAGRLTSEGFVFKVMAF